MVGVFGFFASGCLSSSLVRFDIVSKEAEKEKRACASFGRSNCCEFSAVRCIVPVPFFNLFSFFCFRFLVSLVFCNAVKKAKVSDSARAETA